jgi:hypothetical protein
MFKLFVVMFLLCIHSAAKAQHQKAENWFLDGGIGFSNTSIKMRDYFLQKDYTFNQKTVNFQFGIGYKIDYQKFFLDLYLGFLAHLTNDNFSYSQGSYSVYLNGNNNSILILSHLGTKIKQFEPYIIVGAGFSSFSPKTVNQGVALQKNFFHAGPVFGIGLNFAYKTNFKYRIEIISITSKNTGDVKMQTAELDHISLNAGVKYYF